MGNVVRLVGLYPALIFGLDLRLWMRFLPDILPCMASA